jgi:hypothetical protein
MFIQTEATPATLKVFPGRVVMEEGTFEARGVARLPLARPPRRTCRDARRSTDISICSERGRNIRLHSRRAHREMPR